MAQFKPTSEQSDILGHDFGIHARVFAGPGTGKSATLVALINQLLSGEEPPKVKLLTFTRAATGELAKKVSEHPAVAAERPSTIHSFSISVLLRNPDVGEFPTPLRIADDWERDEVVYTTMARMIKVRKDRLRDLFYELAANFESLEEEESPRVKPEERARFLGMWQEHRQVFGYTLLAELPYWLRYALLEHPDLDGVDYELLLVDEYQDLNSCDLDVLRLIVEKGCSIIGAGDDDQSIYSFRRAAPEGIRRFPTDYPGCADYPLSLTHRCSKETIEWANFVIEGDTGRPQNKPRLRVRAGAPAGEIALLSFRGAKSEARGVAAIVHNLIERDNIAPSEILVLLRSDYRGMFSKPIKEALDDLDVPYSDPDWVKHLLAEEKNRQLLSVLRLLVNRSDSLAWASLLTIKRGIGGSFIDFIYNRAKDSNSQFGETLLRERDKGFPEGPTASSSKALALIEETMDWLDGHSLPEEPESNWSEWIVDNTGGSVVPAPSTELVELLSSIDEFAEEECEFGRYLSQIYPLAKDVAVTESDGVRIMTMAASKGLTVEATVISALEHGIIPRPDADQNEERRLLYVAMTRARRFVYGTWARRRQGPTARAGRERVQQRRNLCMFLRSGPVRSQDGEEYLANRWD